MPAVLTLPVESGVTGSHSFRIREIKFGEGYEQTVGDGLNVKDQDWPVTAMGYASSIQLLLDFLDARGGTEAFFWTPPRGVQGLYKCRAYTTTDVHGDQVKLSATFKRVYQP